MQAGICARVGASMALALCCGSFHNLAFARERSESLAGKSESVLPERVETAIAPPGAADRTVTFENEKVKIWSMTLTTNKPVSIESGKDDSVMLLLQGGRFRSSSLDQKAVETTHPVGDAIYFHAGKEQTVQLISQDSVPAYLVELKGDVSPLLANHSGYPLAYPRPGSKKIMDNARIVVWDYTYTLGQRTAMHFHDKDAVVIFRFEGSINSTTPNGESTVTDDRAGEARFSKAARVHYEELVKGRESVIVVEIK